MRTVLLIRHGAVGGDAAARFLGATDLPMSEAGEAQIRELARASARRVSRSTRSIAAISRGRGGPPNCWRADAASRSASAPRCARSTWANGMGCRGARSPSDGLQTTRRAAATSRNFRPPGGESFADLAARVLPCWRGLVEDGATGSSRSPATPASIGSSSAICSARRSPICSALRSARLASTSSNGGKTSRSSPSSMETACEAGRSISAAGGPVRGRALVAVSGEYQPVAINAAIANA